MSNKSKRVSGSKKGLGFWMLTALVAGNMIGSGVFLLPPALAAYGSISLGGWLLTAFGTLILALVFASMGRAVPRVGGPYAYCREAFGDFSGFQIAYNYWIGLWVGNAAIVVAFVGYLGVFFPTLVSDRLLAFYVALITLWGLTFINIIGVRQAGFIQLISTILKLLPLICVATLGFCYFHPAYLQDFNISGQSNWHALSNSAALTLWAFIGLESATVPAEEVNNPKRNIPLATMVGVVLTACVYIASTIALMGIMPLPALAKSTAPFADAAKLMFGPIGQYIIAAGAAISCFGTLNGWILLQARVPYAAAKDGLFPRAFAKEAKSGTPVVGLVVSAALITGLLILTLYDGLMEQFTFITLLAVLATLIPYLMSTMAYPLIYLKNRKLFPTESLKIVWVLAAIGFIYSFCAFIGAGKEIVFYGSLLFFSSLPIYIWARWHDIYQSPSKI